MEETDPLPAVSGTVVAEFVIRAKENTWSRAARRKMKQKRVETSKGAAKPAVAHANVENTLKRKRAETSSSQEDIPPKKERLNDNTSSSHQLNEPDDCKMVSGVTILVHDAEDETTSRRWDLRIQWMYGRDEHRELFDSFSSHVERKVLEGVR